ncbi:MAG: undecaprenyl-diphosphate phosphatase [Candidatus Dormibacteria bacterium]
MLGAGLILFLAALQGATELFPVSSLGHAVVVPPLLHISFNETDPAFVPILTMLHLGTAAALIVLYRGEWWRIVKGFVRAAINGAIQTDDERLAMMLVVGTIPTGLVGFFFLKPLSELFGNPRASAAFLVVNGAILFAAELYRRRDERRQRRVRNPSQRPTHEPGDNEYSGINTLTLGRALVVGACQIAALFPGISRSGVTMAAGLVAGLRHQESAHFAFLLATPIILAAGLLEVPTLGGNAPTAGIAAAAAVLAGVVSYVSARFLLRYLRIGRLDPFAYYCAALGAAGLVLLR